MFVYRILGVLPSPWEDFFCQDDGGGGPSVCIGDKFQDDSLKIPDGHSFGLEGPDEHDGWYDATVHELTVDTAKFVLAKINNVGPDEIEIIQAGVCASIAST